MNYLRSWAPSWLRFLLKTQALCWKISGTREEVRQYFDICLFICLCDHLSIYLSTCLYLFVIHPSVNQSVCLPIWLSICPGSPRPFNQRGFGGDFSLAWTPFVCTWSFDHWRWKGSRTCTPLGAQKVRCSQHGKHQSSFGGSRGRILWTNFFWCFLTAMSTQNLFETSRHGGPKAPWKNVFA